MSFFTIDMLLNTKGWVNLSNDLDNDLNWIESCIYINGRKTTFIMEKKTRTRSKRRFLPEQHNRQSSLDLQLINNISINRNAVERRVASLVKRRSVKKEYQAAWLVRAIQCLDLTTLSGDDTAGNVARLCAKAKNPLRADIQLALGIKELNVTVGAVCVYQNMIKHAVSNLRDTSIPVAAVSTGFPAGQIDHKQKLEQIKLAVEQGAREIDIVISRPKVLLGDWEGLYQEIVDFRKACGPAHMKSILATGELPDLSLVSKASHVCMMAGSDFIKTSTGKEKVNATLEVSLVMIRAIRNHFERTGYMVGFKPAGGIRTAKQAVQWLLLMKEELGNKWLSPNYFRFGASSILGDIERQLEHFVTGSYSANFRHPMA